MRIKKKNSLGLLKSEKDTSVVVAMSGGVDSSTVAGLMKKEGYNVIGITLKLYDDIKASVKSRQCCSGQDVVDAKRVSNQLNIDHKILYYQKKFKEGVIDNFVDSYLKKKRIPVEQRQPLMHKADKGYTFYKKNPFWVKNINKEGYIWQIK